jgi:DNA-binding response OmpR family regulator
MLSLIPSGSERGASKARPVHAIQTMKLVLQQRILVVEDDPRMLELLCKGLREVGHTAVPASDGEAGFELAMNHDFDAIVLDLGLPLRDGLDIVLALRRHDRGTPVLVVTARDAEDDVIRGLESGADHYLVKPFSFPELLARLNGLARSPSRNRADAQLVLNPLRLTALRDGKVIPLTRSEYLLLATLRAYANQTVSRQLLSKAVWGNDTIESNTLDVLVNSLRSKFDGPYANKRILTVRGVGYLLQSDTDSCLVPGSCAELIG